MELLNEILCGMDMIVFTAVAFWYLVGLQIHVLLGAIKRLSAREVRKVNYKLFVCRVYIAALVGFTLIIMGKAIFGFNAPKIAAVMGGVAIDLLIKKIVTFAYAYIGDTDTKTDNAE